MTGQKFKQDQCLYFFFVIFHAFTVVNFHTKDRVMILLYNNKKMKLLITSLQTYRSVESLGKIVLEHFLLLWYYETQLIRMTSNE